MSAETIAERLIVRTDSLDDRVRDLEIRLAKAPEMLDGHELRLRALEKFEARVTALATVGSLIGGLLSSVITHFLGK